MHHAHRSLRVARSGIRAASSSVHNVPKLQDAQNPSSTGVPRSRSWARPAQPGTSTSVSNSQASGPVLPRTRSWSPPQAPAGPPRSGGLREPVRFRAPRGEGSRNQDEVDNRRERPPHREQPPHRTTGTRSSEHVRKAPHLHKAGQGSKHAEKDTSVTRQKVQSVIQDTLAATTTADDEGGARDAGRGDRTNRSHYKERGSLMSRLRDQVEIPNNTRVTSSRAMTKQREEKKKYRKVAKTVSVDVFIPSVVTVGNLAKLLNVKLDTLRRKMIRTGMEAEASYDHMLTSEYASLLAMEFNRNPIINDEAAFDIYPPPVHPNPSTLPERPPIVTIMGHVDHGKTTLLDTLRSTSVAKGEAGGITQHIGAFSVPVPASGNKADPTRTITFLDTPGHAAFSAMRARGAMVTDVVVLVVAADDGIMPQTREVINLVKGSNVGLVVAINKVDKPGVDVSKVEHALLGEGVQLEAFGGDVPAVHVSGLTGQGLNQLVETISALAEMQDLRAEREGTLHGYVLESKVAKGLGPVATVLVLRGNLKPGQHLICGMASAKVRVLSDANGKPVKVAYPGMAVTVSGWKELPSAGDEVLTGSESDVKKALTNRVRKAEMEASLVDLEAINEQRRLEREKREASEDEQEEGLEGQSEGPQELRLIVKGDVSGTVEAVKGAVEGIGNDLARVKIVSTGVGDVTESDVMRAKTAGGVIIAFSVKVPRNIKNEAHSQHVPILTSSVIYKLIDDVTAKVRELLPPIIEKRVSGEATVLQLFDISLKGKKTAQIGGCRVTNGVVARNKLARVVRNGQVIHEGRLETLKQRKDDVMEIGKGNECGLNVANFDDLRVGDVVETYEEVELPGKL